MSSNDTISTWPSLAGTNSNDPSTQCILPANSIEGPFPTELLRGLVSFVSSRFVHRLGHLAALHRHPISRTRLHEIFNKRIRCDPRFGKGVQQTPLIEEMIQTAVKGAAIMALEAFHEGLTLNVMADVADRLGAETITRTFLDIVTSHPISLVPVTEVFGSLFEDAEEVALATPSWREFTLPAPGRDGNIDVESRLFPGIGRETVGDLPNVSVESGVEERDEASGGTTYVGSINVASWAESRGDGGDSDEGWDFNSSVEALYLGAERYGTGFEGLVHVGSSGSSLAETLEMSEDGSAVLVSFEDTPNTGYEVATGRAAMLDRGPGKSKAGEF